MSSGVTTVTTIIAVVTTPGELTSGSLQVGGSAGRRDGGRPNDLLPGPGPVAGGRPLLPPSCAHLRGAVPPPTYPGCFWGGSDGWPLQNNSACALGCLMRLLSFYFGVCGWILSRLHSDLLRLSRWKEDNVELGGGSDGDGCSLQVDNAASCWSKREVLENVSLVSRSEGP